MEDARATYTAKERRERRMLYGGEREGEGCDVWTLSAFLSK